jgi:hypothetical protein
VLSAGAGQPIRPDALWLPGTYTVPVRVSVPAPDSVRPLPPLPPLR